MERLEVGELDHQEQRAGEARPRLADARERSVGLVLVKIHLALGEHRPPVLDVERGLRPPLERRSTSRSSAFYVVSCERGPRLQPRRLLEGSVQISAPVRVAKAALDANGELGDLPEIRERPL